MARSRSSRSKRNRLRHQSWARAVEQLEDRTLLSATIGGKIYTGAQSGGAPVYAPDPGAVALTTASVMIQNQHDGGAFIAYPTVVGNEWTADVPAGDYVVMFSAPGHDATSRGFTVDDGDIASQDAYLPPLYTNFDGTPSPDELPLANLLVFAFYDNMVNGEPDLPDDDVLNGVTFYVHNTEGDLLATGVTGTQPSIILPDGSPSIIDTGGFYYFTDLPPGEVIVTSDAEDVYLASNPGHSWDASTEFYENYTEEGGPSWEVSLLPGDPGTEDGGFLVWHSYVEKLGQITTGNVADRFPAGTDLSDAGSISGYLLDADGNDPAEPLPTSPGPPGVSMNLVVPDGLVILFSADETVATHPVATAEADPVTGYYSFDAVPPGRYGMMAFDIPLDYVWVQAKVTVGPNEAVAGTGDPLDLHPADPWVPRFFARVQGHVYDDSTGDPVPGATVNLRYTSGSIQQTTITDATGWYNFDDVPEIEVLGHVDVELPAGYHGAMKTDTFDFNLDTPNSVTHNAMNRYVQWFTANYEADLYIEPIPAAGGDIRGVVWNDHLDKGTWVGDGVYDPGNERTMPDVTVELWSTDPTPVLIDSITTGEVDKAAVEAQGWTPAFSPPPPDEWGGVYAGPMPGFYEFRGVPAGAYTVKVLPPAGFSASPGGSDEVAVTVSGGGGVDQNFGINTLVPLAGEIEGGVFDDVNIDENPLSLMFEEKAGLPGAPVGVYDHLGYFMGSGQMGSSLWYAGGPNPPDEADLLHKPEMERRFAPGVHVYFGNDPSLPGYNPNYAPLVMNYTFPQGGFKLEADWSLVPNAFVGLGVPLGGGADILNADMVPEIDDVVPVGSYLVTGSNFGDEQGHSTVTLNGQQLDVISWSDTAIHVDDPPIGGSLIVTTTAGPSNGYVLDTGHWNSRAVYVDADNTGMENGSREHPWNTIGEAMDHLPRRRPHANSRYVFVAPGTYNEHVWIKESDVWLIGSGPQETIVNGQSTLIPAPGEGFSNGGGPVFYIGKGGMKGSVKNVMISGFTITGGSVHEDARANDEVGAGIFADYGNRDLDINNNIIVRNGGYYGGGIWMPYSNHDVNIWSNTIAENGNYGGYGGGISINDEPFYPSPGRPSEDHGEPEHVVDDHVPGPPPGTYEVFNNHIFHNYSPDYGGGMTFYEIKDHLKIHGNLVEDNKADDHGGGAFFEDTGPIDIYCNTFQRNYSRDDGGAISFEDVGDDISIVNVHHNLFLQNIADDNGENSARGGALAFDDTFYARVHDNVIVGNMVAGSFTPAGGSIDSERNGHEYNGSDPLGRDIPPGFSDPKIYNNIIWGNMRLNFDQNHLGEEEDLGYQMGTNYVWSPDELHVDNPALQPPWESYNNSESFTDVWNNAISGAAYAANNIGTDPGFDIPLPIDWNSDGEFPLMQLTPIPGCNEVGFNFETNEFPGPETTTGTVILQPGTRETVYRVNAGGPELNGTPTWSEDTYHHRSPYYAKGSNYSASTRHGIDMSDPSIAGGTPEDLFQTQRRDSRRGDEMQWDFPVTPGTYEVRLYFAEIYRCAQSDGKRIFDVSIEGDPVLSSYDVYADVGGYAGVVKSFQVMSDANLDIDFGHVKRDPAITGIEIVKIGPPELIVNERPTLDAIADQIVDEETLLTLTATGSDTEDPPSSLTYSLDAGAPAGAGIDPSSGQFSWTPDESQGPGVYGVTVRVTDTGGLSGTTAFDITVDEVNLPPILSPIANQTAAEGAELTFTAAANDPDVPANTLTFSLDAGGPSGASIDPSTGAFSWTPPLGLAPASVDVTVRVTDGDGLSDSQIVPITVVAWEDIITHRVNAGGPELSDAPTWTQDTRSHRSPYYTKGSNYSASTRHGINMSDPSIASGTPEDLFQTQRRDSRRGDEMQWDFPVTPGTYEVRLYFAEIYRGAQRDGERIFDVSIEGNLVLDDYDVYADVGGYAGVVKSFVVSSDANLDIDFGHVKRDPAINGIEIIQTLPSLLQVETPLADQAAIPAAGLTVEEITPVVNAAVNRWLDSGLDLRSQQLLADVEITVSDLGGSTLLAATSGRMVKIDDNAAGYGWFVDSTPLDDVEFVVHNDRLEMQSSLSEPGGRMDLLTVLTHELGHVIGLEDHYTESEAGTIMHGFLGPNVRRVPSTMDASMLFSNSRELSRVLDAN